MCPAHHLGVPGSPSPVFVDDITSRTALVTWQPSFSLIDITNYSVSVSEITLDAESAVIRGAVPVGGNLTALNLTVLLRPFRQYRVSVVAINRAGRGEIATSQPFNTSEDGKLRRKKSSDIVHAPCMPNNHNT